MTDMSTWIRLALAASLTIATVPAAMAQCIIDPTQIGTPCAGGIGSPPFVNETLPLPLPRTTSHPRPAPSPATSATHGMMGVRVPNSPPPMMTFRGRG